VEGCQLGYHNRSRIVALSGIFAVYTPCKSLVYGKHLWASKYRETDQNVGILPTVRHKESILPCPGLR
jgi:hypothetical protein